MKKLLVLAALCLLSGCSVYHTPTTRVWIVCYHDDDKRMDGEYYSNQLHIRCNGKKIVQMKHKFGNDHYNDPIILNFAKQYKKDHPTVR